MSLVDLFAKLGLDLDTKGFETADKYIDSLRRQTAAMVQDWKVAEARTSDLHRHFDSVVHDTMRSSRTATEDAIVSWDAWDGRMKALNTISLTGFEDRTKRSALAGVNWAGVWQKAMISAVAATGAAFAVYRGAQGVAGMVTSTAQAAAHADDLGMKLGLTAEGMQELGYAGRQNSTNIDGVADGLGNLAKAAKAAQGGSKDAAKAFKGLGVSAKDIVSGKVPLDNALMEIADSFQAMPDGAAKFNLAKELFGKSGTELIPLLNQGREGIAAMRREAHQMGGVVSDRTAKALKGLGDETDKVKVQLEGVRNEAVAAVVPALLELVKGMQAWIKANRADIVKGLVAAMKGLIQVMEILGPIIAATIKLLAWLGDHADFAKALFGSLAVGLGVTLIPLFYVLTKVIKHAGGALNWIGRTASSVAHSIKSGFGSIGSFISDTADSIRAAFEAVFAWIESKLESLIKKAKDIRERGAAGIFEDVTGVKVPGVVKKTLKYSPVIGPAFGGSVLGPAGQAVNDIRTLSSNTGPRGPRASGGNTTVGPTTINVTSTSADPKQVALETRSAFREFFQKEVRVAKAGIG